MGSHRGEHQDVPCEGSNGPGLSKLHNGVAESREQSLRVWDVCIQSELFMAPGWYLSLMSISKFPHRASCSEEKLNLIIINVFNYNYLTLYLLY